MLLLIDRPRINPAGLNPWQGLATLTTNVDRMIVSVFRSAAGVITHVMKSVSLFLKVRLEPLEKVPSKFEGKDGNCVHPQP